MTCALISPKGQVSLSDPCLPTYQWAEHPGAATYQLWVNDGWAVSPAQPNPRVNLTLTAAQCNPTNGICSYTPTTAVYKGLPCTWWVKPDNAAWSQKCDFVPNAIGLNEFDEVSAALWYFVMDAPGQTRRIIDMNEVLGNVFPYPKDCWTKVDVSDLVPVGTKAIMMQGEIFFTPSSGTPIFAYKSRRSGSTIDPFNYHGLKYSTGPRQVLDSWVVLLGEDRCFDFFWSDRIGTAFPTGTAQYGFNCSMIGYAK